MREAVLARPAIALGLLALGMGIIPLNDALIKILGQSMPLAEIVFIRAMICVAILALFGSGLRQVWALPREVIWRFTGRGMCLVVAMYLFFISLGSLPLSTVITIFFISPLLITILSVPLLGEHIGLHRLGPVVSGMVGVLLVIQPGSADFRPETLLVIASAVCYALFQIWTRRLKSVGNLQAMVTVQHYCYLLSALPFFILNWLMTWKLSGNPSLDFLLRPAVAPTATDLIYLGICAFAVLFLSAASSNAYRSVEASLIAPFEYTAIPLSVFWSIVIWGEWPAQSAWIGMAFIFGGGLYAVYRENLQTGTVVNAMPIAAATSVSHDPKFGISSELELSSRPITPTKTANPTEDR